MDGAGAQHRSADDPQKMRLAVADVTASSEAPAARSILNPDGNAWHDLLAGRSLGGQQNIVPAQLNARAEAAAGRPVETIVRSE